jgi:hypothetical protein
MPPRNGNSQWTRLLDLRSKTLDGWETRICTHFSDAKVWNSQQRTDSQLAPTKAFGDVTPKTASVCKRKEADLHFSLLFVTSECSGTGFATTRSCTVL